MNRGRTCRALALVVALVAQLPAFSADRPNIVLIVTDDQGWADLGVHGNPILKTPNLDQLSRDGAEFTNFYVSPVCSLTRASLLTGRHPLRTGCYDTRNGHDTLAASENTIADVLKTAKYTTGIFGKWHQGRYMPYHPNHRGFDEFFGFWQYGHVERYFYPDRLWHNKARVESRGHITELITDAAIDFNSSASEPYFCYVAYNAPHGPFIAPHELVEKYTRQGVPLRDAQIYALVDHCDTQIGRLLQAIDENGNRDDTVVLFMTDNGIISKHYTAGLRGSKGTVFEGGIRSPFFARYPGRFPASLKISAPSDVVDMLPTIAELAGAELSTDRTIDGVSLVPWLEGKGNGQPHEYLCHTWSRETPRNDVNWAIQNANYKLVNDQLFDLAKDPGESQDLGGERLDVVKQLRAEYERWFDDVTAGRQYGRVPIEVGRDDENPVGLETSWADLHGRSMQYTFDAYDWDFIDGWRQPGDAAAWKTNVIAPGRYEVHVTYGCRRADAGGTFVIRSGDSQVQGTTEFTLTPNVFVTRPVGMLALGAGPAEVRVEARSIPGNELMILNRVSLRRIE